MLEIVHDNILMVDGRFMTSFDTPHDLRRILVLGDHLIRSAIDQTYSKYRTTAPNVQRASIWVMRLADEHREVIDPEHLRHNMRSQSNRGIFSDINAITPGFVSYCEVVQEAGLLPEVRINMRPRNQSIDAAYLLVRDTPVGLILTNY